jgi:hypothetical protein
LILRSSRTAAKRLPGGVGRENGEAAFVADDGLAVDQARAHRQHCQGGDDLREAVREVIAVGPSRRFSGSPFLVAIGGIADISSDARNVEDAPMAEMDRSILLCCKTGLQPGAFCTFRT